MNSQRALLHTGLPTQLVELVFDLLHFYVFCVVFFHVQSRIFPFNHFLFYSVLTCSRIW